MYIYLLIYFVYWIKYVNYIYTYLTIYDLDHVCEEERWNHKYGAPLEGVMKLHGGYEEWNVIENS